MRCMFVTNQRKTGFYSALAKCMERRGVEVFWISLSERWTRYLLAEGWNADRVLSLHRFAEEWRRPFVPTSADVERVARLESVGSTTLKNLLIMDRELARMPRRMLEPYVYVVTREIEKYVRLNEISVAFAEGTWAPEMLVSEVLNANGGGCYNHHTIRIPSNRFGFHRGFLQETISELRAPTSEDRGLARRAIEGLRERAERPYYFSTNTKPKLFRRHWLEEARIALLQPGLDRDDHSIPGLVVRASRRLSARLNAWRAMRVDRLEPAPDASSRPFVLALLHRQPESSVDVLGYRFSNQFEVLKAFARLLPFNWELWIKEHTAALGDRNDDFYRRLLELPGVRLISPFDDTFSLMQRSSLVISVAGTACMEAAAMGLPAITFGNLFFGPILLRNAFDPFGCTHSEMAALLEEAARFRGSQSQVDRVETFLSWLVAQSFEGLVSDPISHPKCLESENLENVATGTIEFLSHSLGLIANGTL